VEGCRSRTALVNNGQVRRHNIIIALTPTRCTYTPTHITVNGSLRRQRSSKSCHHLCPRWPCLSAAEAGCRSSSFGRRWRQDGIIYRYFIFVTTYCKEFEKNNYYCVSWYLLFFMIICLNGNHVYHTVYNNI